MSEVTTRSPFPGMDPYLERRWAGVHTRLVAYVADAIAPQLPRDLAARTQEDVRIASAVGRTARRQTRTPDVAVVEQPYARRTRGAVKAAAAASPAVLIPHPKSRTARRVEIVTLPDERVVTSVEILSPWNKAARRGRGEYLAKRDAVLSSDVSLVEIDLVRAGNWPAMVPPFRVPRRHRTTYRATVDRATGRPDGPLELYRIRLEDRLPVIAVPLRPDDDDVFLDLQPLVDRAYEFGGYDGTDYDTDCDPPLAGDEAAWADALLRAAGRRG